MRGVHGTTPGTGATEIVILNRDFGDAGITTTTLTLDARSNYKNTISFLHSTEGIHQHFCMNTYVAKIENGMYKCFAGVAETGGDDTLTTDVAGEFRIPVKAKLT